MRPITLLALAGIRCYQRFLSPYKGFSCAYRRYTGRASCSAFGYRAIRRFGVLYGYLMLRERLYQCSDIYHQHTESLRIMRSQAGFCDSSCDVPCDADCLKFDLPSVDSECLSSACDTAWDCSSWGDCGDCGGGRRRAERKFDAKKTRFRAAKARDNAGSADIPVDPPR
jgi:putative component of membrane protein insertase Oxa1/YidC/SpoIIIJ protein YidD